MQSKQEQQREYIRGKMDFKDSIILAFLFVALMAATVWFLNAIGANNEWPTTFEQIMLERRMKQGYDSEIKIWADRETKLRIYDPAIVDGDGITIAGISAVLQGPWRAMIIPARPGTTSIPVSAYRYGSDHLITARIESEAGSVTNVALDKGETIAVPVRTLDKGQQ